MITIEQTKELKAQVIINAQGVTSQKLKYNNIDEIETWKDISILLGQTGYQLGLTDPTIIEKWVCDTIEQLIEAMAMKDYIFEVNEIKVYYAGESIIIEIGRNIPFKPTRNEIIVIDDPEEKIIETILKIVRNGEIENG